MDRTFASQQRDARRFRKVLQWSVPALFVLLASAMSITLSAHASSGTFTSLKNSQPVRGTSLLLTDGSVMVMQDNGSACYRLKPDSSGSYVNGTWSALASMHDTRLYFFSVVLKD